MLRPSLFLALVLAATSAAASLHPKAAPYCSSDSVCDPPDCRCISTDVPGGIQREETPQMILLTFDDAVNVNNYNDFYAKLIFNRINPDGCPITVTYFVSHEYNNYTLVNDLYNRGYEIASHSITHRTDFDFWNKATVQEWEREMIDMRTMISNYAGIPVQDIKGTRAPFLLVGGNEMFQAYKQNGIEWDCTWSTRNFVDPGLWPYTLDYRSYQECPVGRCPDESFPGVWVAPMLDLTDRNGNPCAMLDTCILGTTATEVYDKLFENFEVHYSGTRSPYGLYLHAAWLQTPANYEGYKRFLDKMIEYNDVYFVTVSQMLEWVKNPTPISNLGDFDPWKCRAKTPIPCASRYCPYAASLTPFGAERYMSICDKPCPPFYPWYENIYGTNPPKPFP